LLFSAMKFHFFPFLYYYLQLSHFLKILSEVNWI
jgi:hypothetical protein